MSDVNLIVSDYMGERYAEAMADLRENLEKHGRKLDDLTEIFLITFYHHGVNTGINALDMNQNIANEPGETSK